MHVRAKVGELRFDRGVDQQLERLLPHHLRRGLLRAAPAMVWALLAAQVAVDARRRSAPGPQARSTASSPACSRRSAAPTRATQLSIGIVLRENGLENAMRRGPRPATLPAGSRAKTLIGVFTSWSQRQREERDVQRRVARDADRGAGKAGIACGRRRARPTRRRPASRDRRRTRRRRD